MGINYFKRDPRDTKFVLFEQLNLDRLLGYERFQDFDRDDFNMMIEEGLKVGRDTLGPGLQEGDQVGCTWKDGVVTTPDAWKECWRVMAENGWLGMSSSAEFGGQGLPSTVGGLIGEFFNGANMAFMTFAGLAIGNGRLIEEFGTEEDKALFVEKMYTGVWGGTMCLTEPNAGSDVGWLLTKATPDPDSDDPRVYKIEGSKCFITCGEHDLTDNIIHLLLARIEGGPAGTKGISLFIVPKIRVNPDGSMGEPNDVYCAGIEHKMGIHGSSTAQLTFGENGNCRGILLGEPHSGMAKMFQMMNEARLGCGLQSLAQAASAYDAARTYAKERLQGPPFSNRRSERVPIIRHEDVRRMLMNLKAGTEAMRSLLGRMLLTLDMSHYEPDDEKRRDASLEAELMMPLIKAYFTDASYMWIRDAIQILGGVGYCSEFPVEQYARDVKILSIWEGTNYIQALDLVGRKLALDGGKVFQKWMKDIADFSRENKDDADFGPDMDLLAQSADIVGEYAGKFMEFWGNGQAGLIPLNATRFLDNMAEAALARQILEQGLIAREKLADTDPDSSDGIFYRGKIATAKYFCRNILTNVFARQASFRQGDTSALDIPEEAF